METFRLKSVIPATASEVSALPLAVCIRMSLIHIHYDIYMPTRDSLIKPASDNVTANIIKADCEKHQNELYWKLYRWDYQMKHI